MRSEGALQRRAAVPHPNALAKPCEAVFVRQTLLGVARKRSERTSCIASRNQLRGALEVSEGKTSAFSPSR